MDSLPDDTRLKIYSKTDKLPSFSDIRWMALGVVRDKESTLKGYADGEIWVNSLRVRGVKSIDGWAFQTSLTTKWADLMDLSATLKYEDPGFRMMSEEATLDKRARLQTSANAQWALNKFMPEDWGISIPFGMSIGASLERPKMRPGTDIKMVDGDGNYDRLQDMARDFANLILNTGFSSGKTAAEHYQRSVINDQIYASFSKTTYGKTLFTNFTFDRITTNYGYTRDSTTDGEGLRAKENMLPLSRNNIGEDNINVNSKRSQTAGLKYDLSPREAPKWTSWSPFGNIASQKIPRAIKAYELKLLPSRFNFDLINGTYGKEYTYRSLLDTNGQGEHRLERLSINHGMQWQYIPISPLLELNYDLAISRNFDEILSSWKEQGGAVHFTKASILAWDPVWKDYYVLNGEKARTQNGGFKLDPQLFDWLTTTADYAAHNTTNPIIFNNSTGYLRSVLSNQFNFNSSIRIRSLLTALSERFTKRKNTAKVFDVMGTGLDKINFNSIDFR
jgi:cell surface protein SprA